MDKNVEKQANPSELATNETNVDLLSNICRGKDPIFLSSQVCRIEAIHPGGNWGIEPITKYPFGPVSSISTEGKFVVAHHLTPNGEFVVLVNINTIQGASLRVQSDYRLKELTTDKYMNQPVVGGSFTITTSVAPGDWRIFFRQL